jgi:hypothetical protein
MSRQLEKAKTYWGRSTWELFHAMGEKINEDFYAKNNHMILNIVKQICKNLPCPDCARDATIFMNSVHPNSVPNKKEFRAMLFVFHNRVNRKLGKPQFHHSNLLTHKNNNLGIVIQNFVTFFAKRYNGTIQAGITSTEIARRNIASRIAGWFKGNWKYFF